MPVDNKKVRKRIVVEEVSNTTQVEQEPVPLASLVSHEDDKSVSQEHEAVVKSTDENQPVEGYGSNKNPSTGGDSDVEVKVSEPESPEVVEPDAIDEKPASTASVSDEVGLPSAEPPEQEVNRNDPLPVLRSAPTTSPLVIIIPGVFLLGALLGGIYFYQKSVVDVKPSPTPVSATLTPAVIPTPTASASASLDLSKYPISVLNGSGITGEAARLKTVLSSAGFTVSTTGNAANSGFTKTVIKAKVDVPEEFLSKLADVLKKTYVMDTSQTLATSSADKVQIIIGSGKAN